MYYTIYLGFKDIVMERLLPADDCQQYFFDISAYTGKKDCGIHFEKQSGVWRVLSDRNISVTGNDVVEDGLCIGIEIKDTVISGALFLTETDNEKNTFERYALQEKITIGSEGESDIVICGEYVSRKHAEIVFYEGGYILRCLSDNGIYVNGCRIQNEKQLEMFDTIWIFGSKLLFTGESIAVLRNNHFTESRLNPACREFDAEHGRIRCTDSVEIVHGCIASDSKITASLQPFRDEWVKQDKGISDILKTSLPAAALLSAVSVIGCGAALPVGAMLFAGGSALFSGSFYALKSASDRKSEKNAVQKKQIWLKECSDVLENAQNEYRRMMNERYLSASRAVSMFREGRQRISGRSDEDFLKVQVCMGSADFSKYTDAVLECSPDLKEISSRYSVAENIPAVMDFRNEKIFYISGRQESVYSFIRGMAVKISAFHSCTDVKMCFAFPENEFRKIEAVRWLPHSASDEKSVRFCADNDESAEKISEMTEKICRIRSGNNPDECFPHYIVFCSENSLCGADTVKSFAEASACRGITYVMCSFSDSDRLTVTGHNSHIHIETESPDTVDEETALSYCRLRSADENSSVSAPVPGKLGFMEMLGFQDLSVSDIDNRYRAGKSRSSIKALIGYSADRKPFYLDLHETGHGPHGLIAGTTGSGKSELIQTIVLSLVLSYSPDEIAFVLIDYKGGGMSRVFENLPHTAGVLTNLSESRGETGRVLLSLSCEIKKRQQIFKERGVSHIDSYMKMYDEGRADKPLPHLIIICDEFAELRKEQPEFISELVSISRVGRSLGIHLILATQRPSGVVDDEIKSNSSFRICLKVQGRNDSNEMIGKPDAAEITIPGRACIQTSGLLGYEAVQTAYSGKAYQKNDDSEKVCMIKSDGSPVSAKMNTEQTDAVTETEFITESIVSYCRKNNIPSAEKLWTAPLKSIITMAEISEYGETVYEEGLSFCAGITDAPAKQKQYPSVFGFSETGNIIAAGRNGSGKSMFLYTMLCSLVERYSPDDFRFSFVDMSGGISTVFSESVCCDEVLVSPDERKLKKFFDRISAETELRKRRFSEVHASDISEYREVCSDICYQVICIDGYGAFRDLYPSEDEYFIRLSSESVKYGIYFVITVRQTADIRTRMRQNFRTAITFALNDRTEYTDFLGIRPECELPSQPGSGYLVSDRKVLVFQTALCCSGKGREKYSQLSEFIKSVNSEHGVHTGNKEEKFCSFIPHTDVKDFSVLSEKYARGGRLIVWDQENDAASIGTECFFGAEGACQMLHLLKDIFTQRNMERKISGRKEYEPVTVMIRGLDYFCRCIYKAGSEDQAGITEKFLTGGEGFGVRFIAEAENNPENGDCRVFRLFSEKCGGAIC